MDKVRSRGVAFWGNFLIILGIIYGLINSARNIWRLDYVGLPILFVVIGIGILSLNNIARIILLFMMGLLILSAIWAFPQHLSSMSDLSKEGIPFLVVGIFMLLMRFVMGIGCFIFFLNRSVKEQFKKGGSL